MILQHKDRLFDTFIDTKKIYVAIRAKLTPREYKNSEGKSPVQLILSGNKERERIPLPHITVDTALWDSATQRLKPVSQEAIVTNLLLDNVMSKITTIKTNFHLSERVLTPASCRREFESDMPRTFFPAFFLSMLEAEKPLMEPGTYNRHRSVVKKIQEFNPQLTFMDIDYQWFEKYKQYLAGKGNLKTTIASNMASILKFLRIAQKMGIKLRINIDDIKPGSTKGNRTALYPHEVKRLSSYYYSDFINPSWRLVVGYFLFSCNTGLRISDVQTLERKDFQDGYVTLISKKTGKDQSISLNKTVSKILAHEPRLFVEHFADQHINDELKKIMAQVGITKKVTFHVARHTFATSFIRAGGNPIKLQKLLGHSSISQTMVYVHMVEAEANSEIFLLDNLFQ